MKTPLRVAPENEGIPNKFNSLFKFTFHGCLYTRKENILKGKEQFFREKINPDTGRILSRTIISKDDYMSAMTLCLEYKHKHAPTDNSGEGEHK